MSSCKTLTCVTDEEIKPTKLFYHVCPSDLPASPLQDNKQCGVYSGFEGHWQSLSCESALPYICKKTPNDTRGAEPLGENMLTRRRHKHIGDLSASLEVSVLCCALTYLNPQNPVCLSCEGKTSCSSAGLWHMTLSMPRHGSQMFPQP